MFIFCGGMQRAGSTLQFQLAASIVEAAGAGQRLPWIEAGDLYAFLKPSTNGQIEVVKSHTPVRAIVRRVDDGTAQALYIYRDLRDIVVSMMNRYGIPFTQAWGGAMIHDAVGYSKTWEELPGVLVQRYEDLMLNLFPAIDEICEHIGIDLSYDEKCEIDISHSVGEQQKHINSIPENDLWNARELLHRNHIGKQQGLPGQWRTALNLSQTTMIERRYGQWLVDHGYELTAERKL